MSNESLVIYSMNKVRRIVPPNKQILRDISLGFYCGVKTPSLNRTQRSDAHVSAHSISTARAIEFSADLID